jgi:hypothetical protein
MKPGRAPRWTLVLAVAVTVWLVWLVGLVGLAGPVGPATPGPDEHRRGRGRALASEAGGLAILLVIGAEGTPEYGARFREAADRWQKAALRAGARAQVIGLASAGPEPDRRRLQESITQAIASSGDPLWLVLIGHGTFDGRTARFNLRGPDVAPDELAAWLEPSRRPVVIINGASASAPFLKPLAGKERIVVTATRAGSEQSATRFGGFLADAIADDAADLDRDGGISLLEAFLFAAKRVEASFKEEGLLATEHALLEDNGDGRGTPASFFQGLAPTRRPADNAAPDGHRAHQIALIAAAPERALPPTVRRRRDELELRVLELRDGRAALPRAVYHARLEPLLLELARLYRKAEKAAP